MNPSLATTARDTDPRETPASGRVSPTTSALTIIFAGKSPSNTIERVESEEFHDAAENMDGGEELVRFKTVDGSNLKSVNFHVMISPCQIFMENEILNLIRHCLPACNESLSLKDKNITVREF